MTGSSRDGFIYSAALVLPRLPAFLLLPVFASVFSLAEMGILATCWIFVDLFQTLAGLGMRQALGRFFPLAKGPLRRREVLATVMATTFGGGAAMALLALAAYGVPAIRGRLEFLSAIDLRLLGWLLLAATMANLSGTLAVYFRAERRPWAFLVAAAAGAVIELGLASALILLDRLTVTNILVVECVKQAVMLGLVAWQGRRDLVPAFSRETWASLSGFAFWLVPVGICDWVAMSADRFWLGQLSGLDRVGVYGFFAKLATPLGVLFTGAVMELHSRLYAMRGGMGLEFARERLERYLMRGGWMALGLSALFPLAFLAVRAVKPAFPEGYSEGLRIFPVMVATVYVLYWGRYYGAALEYGFRTRAILLALGLSAAAAALVPLAIRLAAALGHDPLAATALAALAAALVGTGSMGRMAGLGGGAVSQTRQVVRGAAFLAGCLACYGVLSCL